MFPKTYHADEVSIVLENITKNGFKMISKAAKQDFQHARYKSGAWIYKTEITHVIPYNEFKKIRRR